MKILILGHGRHGKDTAAEYLRDKYGMSFISSSLACAEVLHPVLDLVIAPATTAQHYAARHQHRELWKRLISLYNAADPSALVRLITSKCDMYVGMRSQREYEASKHLFNRVLWIDGGRRVYERDPTMEIEFHANTMDRVWNDSDLDNLHTGLDAWMRSE